VHTSGGPRQESGVLTAWNKRQQGFGPYDSRLMSLFADQAAMALHNARLHAESNGWRLNRNAKDWRGISTTRCASHFTPSPWQLKPRLRLLDGVQADDHARECFEYILSLSRSTLAETREQLHTCTPRR